LRRRYRVPLPSGRVLALGERTLVMAIVNVTPDSFADGGKRADPDVAIADALRLVEEGADLIDIGGESTRPGALPVPAEEEWRRVGSVIEGLRGRLSVPLSIDTYKAQIARQAIDLGAEIVNDVSALAYDPALAGVVAEARAAIILMHNRGRSSDMYARAEYVDVATEVTRELAERDLVAREAGIAPDRIIVDPGLGFAKRASHTFEMLARLDVLTALDRPILSGPSQKSFLRDALGDGPPDSRRWGTAAAITASVLAGAHIVRVHDVKAMVDVARTADQLTNYN
jgi:dihydropteroate synthase